MFTVLVNLGSFFNQIKWLTVRSIDYSHIIVKWILYQYLNKKKVIQWIIIHSKSILNNNDKIIIIELNEIIVFKININD